MKQYTGIAVFAILAAGLLSCKKRKEEKLNEALYNETVSSSFTFYRGIDSVYTAAGGSPHGSFKLKFNSTAAAALTDNGRLPAGQEFPDGSLILKEVNTGSGATLYVVMKKDKSSKFKSEGDWVWAEYGIDGEAVYSAGKKGESCTGCHTSGTTRDFVRSFDLH
ncbi:MAG: hypothetical protein RL007_1749 [Bacteroidota bacterium]|jgi:hypothetical protein